MDFELLIDAKAGIAETPIWDGRTGRLYWTDVATGDIHAWHKETGEGQVWHTGRAIGSAVPCEDEGKMFCALDGGLFLFDLETGGLEPICDPDGRPGYRYNDSRIDERGRAFTSSVSAAYGSDEYQPDMKGNFYMVDTDGSVTTLVEGVNQYNGIVWNKEGTKMYVVDTWGLKLMAFPYDIERGPTGDPECVLDLKEFGMPDGINIDEEGSLYICHWTGRISVWDRELKPAGTIPFPVEFVCCGGFGGDDGKDYYVASSSWKYTDADFEKNPGAGGVFVARSEIAGRGDFFYKG